jgi:hypothetical protein
MRNMFGRSAILCASLAAVANFNTALARGFEGCRQSSHIPSLNPLTLRNIQGTTLALQRSVQHGMPSVRVWVNGQFAGEHDVPFSAYGGQIQVRLHQRMRLETWLGSVRQALKPLPYLLVCGEWFGELP